MILTYCKYRLYSKLVLPVDVMPGSIRVRTSSACDRRAPESATSLGTQASSSLSHIVRCLAVHLRVLQALPVVTVHRLAVSRRGPVEG